VAQTPKANIFSLCRTGLAQDVQLPLGDIHQVDDGLGSADVWDDIFAPPEATC